MLSFAGGLFVPVDQLGHTFATIAEYAPARSAGRRDSAVQECRTPCSTQVAVQPVGITWTFIRRRQSGQNRGGSSARAARHAP